MADNIDKQKALAKLAVKIMRDRQLLAMFTDKIYAIMLEDLQQQKERLKNY
ncbi:MAG: hypothetical protein VKL60_21130 [Sphaerospermopsis sp.]|nr:hypothetical protein [Sphaerospermopsis sp.]